jgi:nicotinamidase-related amidase
MPKHPSGINQKIVDKVASRRGRLHAYETINPATTALVVIDLDTATMGRMLQDTGIKDIVQLINTIASTLRTAGGHIAWVTTPMTQPSDTFRVLFGEQTTRAYIQEATSGASKTIWRELDAQPADISATKQDYSAFFPGKSDLHDQLQARGVNTVLIVGTVTNVCCESAARDAYELGYKVIMVSDALTGHANGLHEASLATIFRNFGDVRPTFDILQLLRVSKAPHGTL